MGSAASTQTAPTPVVSPPTPSPSPSPRPSTRSPARSPFLPAAKPASGASSRTPRSRSHAQAQPQARSRSRPRHRQRQRRRRRAGATRLASVVPQAFCGAAFEARLSELEGAAGGGAGASSGEMEREAGLGGGVGVIEGFAEALVGKRVSMFWESAGAWFDAEVLEAAPPSSESPGKRYRIRYANDGVEEVVSLCDRPFRIISPFGDHAVA